MKIYRLAASNGVFLSSRKGPCKGVLRTFKGSPKDIELSKKCPLSVENLHMII